MLDWPLENVLGEMREQMKRRAREEYRFTMLASATAGVKLPKPPAIIADEFGE